VPLFEYECSNCKARFEQLVFDREAAITCRRCGSSNMTQLLSTFAVGSESRGVESQANPCSGCQGMKGGSCPMNQ
jgi:putative FmdB family regulatory protein